MITAETLIGVSISILYISRTIGLYIGIRLCLRPRSKRNIFLRKAWQFAKMKKWSIYSESQRQSWVASQHNAWFQSYLTADHDIPRSRLLKTQYVSLDRQLWSFYSTKSKISSFRIRKMHYRLRDYVTLLWIEGWPQLRDLRVSYICLKALSIFDTTYIRIMYRASQMYGYGWWPVNPSMYYRNYGNYHYYIIYITRR
jgi:hypothetical protein